MAQDVQSGLGPKAQLAAMGLPAETDQQACSAESVAEKRAIANTRDHAAENTNELQQAQSDLNLLAILSRLGFGGG